MNLVYIFKIEIWLQIKGGQTLSWGLVYKCNYENKSVTRIFVEIKIIYFK